MSDMQGPKRRDKAGRSRKAGKQWEWNPLKEGSWHPDFAVDSMTVAGAKRAVQEAEAKRAAERGSGSADEADPIQTGKLLLYSLVSGALPRCSVERVRALPCCLNRLHLK